LRGDAQTEVDSAHPIESTAHVVDVREISDHELRTRCAQRRGPLVVVKDEGAHGQAALPKELDHRVTDAADTTASTRDENGSHIGVPRRGYSRGKWSRKVALRGVPADTSGVAEVRA
jgi:hypothetical protein